MEKILVADIHRTHGVTAISVRDDTFLGDVIARFALDPRLSAIFLVDSTLMYAGMISRMDLMRWAHVRLFGGKGRHEIPLREISHIVNAQKAVDLKHRDQSYSVREDDPLQVALDKMLDHDEYAIPVLDGQDRIVGDLTLAEVLLHAIKYYKGHADANDA